MSLYDIYEMERALPPILNKMEKKGIKVNQEKLHILGEWVQTQQVELLRGILEGVPVTSPKQLGVYLFETLGLPNMGKTEASGQYITDEGALKKVMRKQPHPILEAVLKSRELGKQKGTYVDALLNACDDNSRVHTHFSQTKETGRFSSYGPNLQNQVAPDDQLPHDQDFGYMLRSCFEAEEGYLLEVNDYSQIEYRVIAAMSSEPYLIQAFEDGQDIHQAVTELLGVASRRIGKTLNFGVVYGLGVSALAQSLGMPVRQAKVLSRLYWERLPRVQRFIQNSHHLVRVNGYVETMFGRRNYYTVPEVLPDMTELEAREVNNKAAAILREAFNMRVQGTAADIIKMLMPQAYHIARRMGADMLLQVHDELVFECPEGNAQQLMGAVQLAGSQVVDIGVPISMSGGVGRSWAEAK